MGFLEDLLKGKEPTQMDFQRMAAERMAHGLEPIDWETILRQQAGPIYPTQPEQPRKRKHVESRVIETKQITGEKAK